MEQSVDTAKATTALVAPASAKPARARSRGKVSLVSGLIKDAKTLSASIDRHIAAYRETGNAIHTDIVSALWHTAKYGNPVLFQRIWDGLRENDQQRVRLFVRRVSILVGCGKDPFFDKDGNALVLPAGKGQVWLAAGKMMDIAQGTWKVTVDGGHTSKVAKDWAALMENRFSKPDLVRDRLILDGNNISEMQSMGDTDVLQRIVALGKLLDSKSERRTVKVSDKVRKLVGGAVSQAQTMLGLTADNLAKG